MQAVETVPQFVNLRFTDWEKTRQADLEGVDRGTTVAELVSEAVRALGLPLTSFYQALFKDRQLPQAQTVEELGIHTDDEIELYPEVSAG